MDFHLALTVVKLLLRHEGRVSYRTLERGLGIRDGLLEDLKHELVEFGRVARDENGVGLVWIGEPEPPATAPEPRAGGGSTPPSPRSRRVEPAPGPGAADRKPDPASTPADAERRQLTVMFCDLVGSTALSTQLDPEDLREVITAFQDRCRDAIARYGGFIARYMGDGMLVYFGYPQAHEDDAGRAVRAGLDVVGSMAGLNAGVGKAHGAVLAVRIGVATGPVVVGDIIGEGAAEEAAVVGETPNLAARLQGVASPNQLVVDATARRLVAGHFELAALGTHELKGITEPVPAWRVCGERVAEHEPPARPGSGRQRLVGRHEEVGLLLRAWESSRAGRGQVVLIQGEAGIGKSRLLAALRERIDGEDYLWVAARGSPYHTNSTLYPVIEQIGRSVGWTSEEGGEGRLAKLEAALEGQSRPLAEVVPLMAELLRVPLPPGRYAPSALGPEQKRDATLDAIVGWLTDEAERRPVLQVWEDLHWGDPTTLELLGLYIEQSPTVAMLNVLTYRPEFVPPWAMRSHMTPITLGRLERPEVEALIGLRANGKAVPEAVVEHVVDKADGVPLYVEELTRAILESDYLREEADRYALAGTLSELAIPATLQDSLMARLDRVPGLREMAQLGAVLGREFAYEMLRSLAALEEPALQAGLERLVEHELLYQRGRPPRARYTFKHALIHDAAYRSLLRRTRRQYHEQVARLLEERFPEMAQAHPELLAHHYAEAGDPAQGAAYWHRAGEQARAVSANEEAIGHVTSGLAVLRGLPEDPDRDRQELALQLSLGHASLVAKGHGAEEVEAAYGRARALCQRLGDVPELLPALFGLWRFYIVGRPLAEAAEMAAQLLRLAAAGTDPAGGVIAHYAMGFTRFCRGGPAQGREHLERAIAAYAPAQRGAEVYRAAQDPGTACLVYSALCAWLLGFPDQARARMREGIALADELEDAVSRAHALSFGTVVSEMCGDDAVTESMADQVITLATERGFALWSVFGQLSRRWIACKVGPEESALGELKESVDRFAELGMEVFMPYFATLLAEAYRRNERWEKGLAALERGQAIVDGRDERWWEAEIHRQRGELLLARSPGNGADAEAWFEKALDLARRQEATSLELRAAMSLARQWHARGRAEPAAALLRPVHDRFTEGFDTADLRRARGLLEAWGG